MRSLINGLLFHLAFGQKGTIVLFLWSVLLLIAIILIELGRMFFDDIIELHRDVKDYLRFRKDSSVAWTPWLFVDLGPSGPFHFTLLAGGIVLYLLSLSALVGIRGIALPV